MTPSFDYIVVGAGSAGCVLANRLSANPDVNVLLLEAGPRDKKKEIRIPAAFPKLFKTEYDWGYETEPQEALDGRKLYWPRGRTLGGSSAVNAQMWVRGNPLDYDGWAALGNDGWSYDQVLPYFKRAERHQSGANEDRGADGPLSIEGPRSASEMTRSFVEAGVEAGMTRHDDVNVRDQDGIGFAPLTQDRGARASAAWAYLKPVRRRPNLTIKTGAQVARILFDGGRARGVACVEDQGEAAYDATREVIVSAGAVNSPQLLMVSGIGPAGQLAEHGIELTVDLPGVGQNLRDHPAMFVIELTDWKKTLVSAESPRSILRYLLFRRGPLTSNVGEGCAFVRVNSDAPAPDIELVFAPVPFMEHGLQEPPDHGMTIGPILLQPESVGEITLRSADPLEPPVIQPRYLSDPAGHDMATMVEGTKLARKLFASKPFERYGGKELWPGPEAQSDEEFAAAVRKYTQTLYHPVGTCRMGTDDGAVVDPELRVRGVEGLRVVDASVMPRLNRGHTHAPTVMIAERAAELIAAA
ncbi:MAG: GMC family oxidoreductase N-terminal domain-containing protein [Solirubrobacterales bacterium]